VGFVLLNSLVSLFANVRRKGQLF